MMKDNKFFQAIRSMTVIEYMIMSTIVLILVAIITAGVTSKPQQQMPTSIGTPSPEYTQIMQLQVDQWQKMYNISELNLPEVMRNPNRDEWFYNN